MMLCFVFSALIVILDQFFKRWILRTIELGGTGPEIIPNILGLTHWENDGAMLNFLSGQQWLLALIALLASVILIAILLRYNEGFWGTLGLAAVLGGTIGNLMDRVFNDGKVIDMFRTLFINFPIFNIADIFITLGFITFLVHFIVLTFKEEDSEAPAGNTPARTSGKAVVEDDYESYENDEEYDSIEQLEDIGVAPAAQPAPVYQQDTYEQDTYTQQDSYTQEMADIQEEPGIQEEQIVPEEEYEELDGSYDSTTDTTPDISFTLEALESELENLDVEYDVDDILREYGLGND